MRKGLRQKGTARMATGRLSCNSSFVKEYASNAFHVMLDLIFTVTQISRGEVDFCKLDGGRRGCHQFGVISRRCITIPFDETFPYVFSESNSWMALFMRLIVVYSHAIYFSFSFLIQFPVCKFWNFLDWLNRIQLKLKYLPPSFAEPWYTCTLALICCASTRFWQIAFNLPKPEKRNFSTYNTLRTLIFVVRRCGGGDQIPIRCRHFARTLFLKDDGHALSLWTQHP